VERTNKKIPKTEEFIKVTECKVGSQKKKYIYIYVYISLAMKKWKLKPEN
jgi:hypothetical protein